MSFNYVVTAQKPTCVTHCVVANFTSSSAKNLILAKMGRIELYSILEEGQLKPIVEVPLYGRVFFLAPYRQQKKAKDFLFIAFESNQFCVLEYCEEMNELKTLANGDFTDNIGDRVETGLLGVTNDSHTMIGMHLFDGRLKILPIENTPQSCAIKDAFNVRIEESHVIDMCFVKGFSSSTNTALSRVKACNDVIAILCEDSKGEHHLRSYSINQTEKEANEGPLQQNNVEVTSSKIIPVPLPFGGVAIIGETQVTYHNGAFNSTRILPENGRAPISAWCYSGNGILCSTQTGHIFELILNDTGFVVTSLGETHIASCLSHLGSDYYFLGGQYSDSQIVHLDPIRSGDSVHVLENITNVGPIVDMCVVNSEGYGKGQVVTCSGWAKDGSLRVVRNGIGLAEVAKVGLSGVKGLWTLYESVEELKYRNIIISFIAETKVLTMTSAENIEEVAFPGLNASSPTLLCCNIYDASGTLYYLQVTPGSCILISAATKQRVAEWTSGGAITLASACGEFGQIAVASGSVIEYLRVEQNKLTLVKTIKAANEIACLEIRSQGNGEAKYVAFATWVDIRVFLLRIGDGEIVTSHELKHDTIPRSVVHVTLDGTAYLMCGLGDGTLTVFTLLETAIVSIKTYIVGTQPLQMSVFRTQANKLDGAQTHIFISTDRPTVVYSTSKKLMLSNANLSSVLYSAPFNLMGQDDEHETCLALVTPEDLVLGVVDEIEKLHIHSIPLGEGPLRICHHAPSDSFVVLCSRSLTAPPPPNTLFHSQVASAFAAEEGSCSDETHFVRLITNHTFDPVSSFQLDSDERACSVLTTRLGQDPTEYIIVGTAYVCPGETESSRGRILVLEENQGRLILVAEKDVHGMVYSMHPFNGKLLSTANSKIHLWKWNSSLGQTDETNRVAENRQLEHECFHNGNVTTLCLNSHGDYIIVGDMMRSITVLQYKSVDSTISEVASDYNPTWMTALEILDADTYLGAEHCGNLFTLVRNSESASEEDMRQLQPSGFFHSGDFVNVMRRGSPLRETPSSNPVIFGCQSGAIAMVCPIDQPLYVFLLNLQKTLCQVIRGVGGLSFDDWRMFKNEKRRTPWKNFIDGDVIESFLDLPRQKMEEVFVKLIDIHVASPDGKDISIETKLQVMKANTNADFLPASLDELITKVENLSSFCRS